jgi:hypothetical protein
MSKYFLKNKESGKIAAAKKKGGWTSLSFWRADVSRQNRPRYERNSSATRDKKKTSHKQKLIKN